MARGGDDHNRFLGRAGTGSAQLAPFASFVPLFEFDRQRQDALPLTADPKPSLPGNGAIERDRFVHAETPVGSSRRIATHLAPPLGDRINQPASPAVMKRPAMRNLRRGYRLNIPSARGLIAAINATGLYRPIPVLTPEQVAKGRDVLTDPGLDAATPLWFHVLREAELVGANPLGAPGSHLVANALTGPGINDPASFWNPRIGGHRWSPHLFRPSQPIDGLKAMLRFAGLLA